MPRPFPMKALAKQLLLEGSTYEEVVKVTALSKKELYRITHTLRNQGHHVDPRGPEKLRSQTLKMMPYGRVGGILDRLTQEELEALATLSFESWEDAIATIVLNYMNGELKNDND